MWPCHPEVPASRSRRLINTGESHPVPHPCFTSARTKGIPCSVPTLLTKGAKDGPVRAWVAAFPSCPLEESEVGEQKLVPRSRAESTAGLHAAVSPAGSPRKGFQLPVVSLGPRLSLWSGVTVSPPTLPHPQEYFVCNTISFPGPSSPPRAWGSPSRGLSSGRHMCTPVCPTTLSHAPQNASTLQPRPPAVAGGVGGAAGTAHLAGRTDAAFPGSGLL